jgi:hypothetical protein
VIGKTFVTAGRAVFTLELPETYAKENSLPGHLTYKVRRSKDGKVYFVSRCMGATYEYIGLLSEETGGVRATAKSKEPATALPFMLVDRTLRRLWAGEGEVLKQRGFDLHHEGRCGRCGRELTVPESIALGIGPECAKEMGL